MSQVPQPRKVRRYRRRSALLPVVVRAPGNRFQAEVRLDTVDLSEGGLFLRSDLLFEVGDDLSIEIPLGHGEVTVARGRVAWVTRGGDGKASAGMGIEFARLSENDRHALAECLRALAPSEPSKA